MTERLYYDDSFLYDFDASVVDVIPASAGTPRAAIILDRTAFYPSSGGQTFDIGLLASGEYVVRVLEVSESDEGAIYHFVDDASYLSRGQAVRGSVDAERRRDHMQQHSGQHVLSASFIRLFDMPTVSFHMGEDYCSIDLETKALSLQQIEAAERMANEIILEDRLVEIKFVSQQEARVLKLRKFPHAERGLLRLISIRDFDLSACGGTHVRYTGQIGCILLRKSEKVRQGSRVEFVCGQRAVKTARRDYTMLTESASLFSCHIRDVPAQVKKAQAEIKAAHRGREQALEELAEQHATRLLSETMTENGRKLVVRLFTDRDLAFLKLLAQKLTGAESHVVALLGTTTQLSLLVACSPGQAIDLGGLLRHVAASHGGRGGGSEEMAQAGVPTHEAVEGVLTDIAEKIRSLRP
ncbi:MAG: alanyl-tRNA editing protein [Acidobacteria bacterium]|nr:alanyl-tRNA editing protein [Acidobacteriota bacterium]